MPQEIKAAIPNKHPKPADVYAFGMTIDSKLTNNSNYTSLPIPLTRLQSDLASLNSAMLAAADGGRTAVASCKNCMETVLLDLRLIASHVSAASDGNMEVFFSSGFTAKPPRARTTPQPLPPASIKDVSQGNSGTASVDVTYLRGAHYYGVRCGAPTAVNGVPSTWMTVDLTSTKAPAVFTGLNPGTTYMFQVRALGKAGYTDWSDPVSRMCI